MPLKRRQTSIEWVYALSAPFTPALPTAPTRRASIRILGACFLLLQKIERLNSRLSTYAGFDVDHASYCFHCILIFT